MAGRGPAPKDPSRRARRNADPAALRVITAEPAAQPDLPSFHVEKDGELVEFRWPARTEEWWQMWGESPLAAEFTSTDWSELLDTAVLRGVLVGSHVGGERAPFAGREVRCDAGGSGTAADHVRCSGRGRGSPSREAGCCSPRASRPAAPLPEPDADAG